MSRARSLGVWALTLAAVWLALCAAVGVFGVEGALHPPRLQLDADDEARAHTIAARDGAALTSVQITAADGPELRAWFLRPSASNGDAVLLLHRQADNRSGMLSNADLLLHHGFAVLLPDARSHGNSG